MSEIKGRYSGHDVYRINKKICVSSDHSKKANCKQNPKCLFGLGERKEGLWSSNSISKFDSFSSITRADTPVGLDNLGATCYVNVLIQCLFFNLPFRDAVYRWKSSESSGSNSHEDDVIESLQQSFALLEFGNKRSVNLLKLTSALQIEAQIQQDAQEFNKLLLDFLRKPFNRAYEPEIRLSIDRLFRGKEAYITQCNTCGHRSVNICDLFELPLNIASCKSVQECLSRYIREEILQGEEQYECEKCQRKRDAVRKVELIAEDMPPFLNLQLLRFVYDTQTWSKKKLNDAIAIPHTLDMSPFVSANGQPNLSYNLIAVLSHQGTTAYHGHYVADILDAESNKWWHFDDQIVRPYLDKDNSKTLTNKRPPKEPTELRSKKRKCRSGGTEYASDSTIDVYESDKTGNQTNQPVQENSSSSEDLIDSINTQDSTDHESKKLKSKMRESEDGGFEVLKSSKDWQVTSRNAYMVVYVRSDWANRRYISQDNTVLTHRDTQEAIDSLQATQNSEAKMKERLQPHIYEFVAKENRHVEKMVSILDLRCTKAKEAIECRKEAYNRLFQSIEENSDEFVWVSSDWLRSWITGIDFCSPNSISQLNGSSSLDAIDLTNSSHQFSQSLHLDILEPLAQCEEKATQDNCSCDNEMTQSRSDDWDPHSVLFRKPFDGSEIECKHKNGIDPTSIERLKILPKYVYDGILVDMGLDLEEHPLQITQDTYICHKCIEEYSGIAKEHDKMYKQCLEIDQLLNRCPPLANLSTLQSQSPSKLQQKTMAPIRKSARTKPLNLCDLSVSWNCQESINNEKNDDFDGVYSADKLINDSSVGENSAILSIDANGESCIEKKWMWISRSWLRDWRAFFRQLQKFHDKMQQSNGEPTDSNPSVDSTENKHQTRLDMWLLEGRCYSRQANGHIASNTASREPVCPINSSITCDHGGLIMDKKKRCLVSHQIWEAFSSRYETGGEFDATVEACAVCLAEIEMKSERKQMCESNLVLYKLYTREKCFPEKPKDVDNLLPIAYGRYAILPQHWILNWKAYIDGESYKEPENIPSYREFSCEHGNSVISPVLYSFLAYGDVNGMLNAEKEKEKESIECSLVKASNESKLYPRDNFYKLSIITEEEHNALCEYFGITNSPLWIDVIREDSKDESTSECKIRGISFDPPLCSICCEHLNKSHNEYKLAFINCPITIEVLNPSENPMTAADELLQAQSSVSAKPKRRTRSRGSREKHTVICSSTDMIGLIKLKVYELSDYDFSTMQLYYLGNQVESYSTLAECGIPRNATLHLKILSLEEIDLSKTEMLCDFIPSVDSECSAQKDFTMSNQERGFKGTLLSKGFA